MIEALADLRAERVGKAALAAAFVALVLPLAMFQPSAAAQTAPAATPVPPVPVGPPMDAEHAKMLEDVRAEEAHARAEIERAERESRSDSDLLRRLEKVAEDHHLAGEKARAAFIRAAMRLQSDEAKGDALQTLLMEAPITVDTGRAILRAAATIGADEPKLGVLVYVHKIQEHMLFHGPLAGELVQTAATFHSDEGMAEALFQMLHPYPVPREAVVQALVLARDRMHSDDARQRVLVEVKDHHLDAQAPEIERLYREVADKMGADEREEALRELDESLDDL